MTIKRRTKKLDKQINEAILETAEGLYDAGVINAMTMREYNALCLPPIKELSAKEIKKIRLKEKVSQAVFAKFLNISPATVRSWEQGENHPQGCSLMLLNLIAKKGLNILVCA